MRYLTKLKIFAFHFSAYILINMSFWGILKYQQKTAIAIMSGDANLGLFVSLMIIFLQVFLGTILSLVYLFVNKIENWLKTLLFILVNSLLLLFFIYINTTGSGLFYNYIYIIGGILLSFSILYFISSNKARKDEKNR